MTANLMFMPGRLFLCATPIGNLGDVSDRLKSTLASVDAVFAEDTRRSAKLLNALGVSVPLRSFFTGNEKRRADDIYAELETGRSIAVLTDAGTPGVSDPGALAVAAARRAGAEVVVIPGPSAVTAAVAGSGMVQGPFVFHGFLERKGSGRGRQLAAVAGDERPGVLFLSPHRLAADLADLAEACGPGRPVCVARELTKIHEELWWATLGEAAERWSEEPARGEFTVVVAGAPAPEADLESAVGTAREFVANGLSASQAAREAAAATGASRRQIYDALVNPEVNS